MKQADVFRDRISGEAVRCVVRGALRSLLLAAALVGAGCADLAGVREFAALSAAITGSGELSAHWRDASARLKRIEQPGDRPIGLVIPDRTHVHEETEKILVVVTSYLDVMGELAAGSLPAVDQQVGRLASSLATLPGTPIDAGRVQAVSIIASLVSGPLDAYRHLKVRELIARVDPSLQPVLTGLQALAKIYRADFAAEQRYLKGWVSVQVGGGSTAADFLARRYMAELMHKYQQLDEGVTAYVQALQTIGARHAALVDGLATRATLERTLGELKATRRELTDAREKLRLALAQRP